jgi:hypothetical protein
MVKLDEQQVSVDFTVALLCITVKFLQRTCLPRKSKEFRVDMLVAVHTATGFGIYSDPRRQQMALIRESG